MNYSKKEWDAMAYGFFTGITFHQTYDNESIDFFNFMRESRCPIKLLRQICLEYFDEDFEFPENQNELIESEFEITKNKFDFVDDKQLIKIARFLDMRVGKVKSHLILSGAKKTINGFVRGLGGIKLKHF